MHFVTNDNFSGLQGTGWPAYLLFIFFFSFIIYAAPIQCITPTEKFKKGQVIDLVCKMEYGGTADPEIVWYADDKIISTEGSAAVKRYKINFMDKRRR